MNIIRTKTTFKYLKLTFTLPDKLESLVRHLHPSNSHLLQVWMDGVVLAPDLGVLHHQPDGRPQLYLVWVHVQQYLVHSKLNFKALGLAVGATLQDLHEDVHQLFLSLQCSIIKEQQAL